MAVSSSLLNLWETLVGGLKIFLPLVEMAGRLDLHHAWMCASLLSPLAHCYPLNRDCDLITSLLNYTVYL